MILILDNGREYSDHAYAVVDVGDVDPRAVEAAVHHPDAWKRWHLVCSASQLEDFHPPSITTLGEWVWGNHLGGAAWDMERTRKKLKRWQFAANRILADLRNGIASEKEKPMRHHRGAWDVWPDEQDMRHIEMALFGIGDFQ